MPHASAAANCAPSATYNVFWDADSPYGDIRRVSTSLVFDLNAATAACDAEISCKGFNTGNMLKSDVTLKSISVGTCLYTKGAHYYHGRPKSPSEG